MPSELGHFRAFVLMIALVSIPTVLCSSIPCIPNSHDDACLPYSVCHGGGEGTGGTCGPCSSAEGTPPCPVGRDCRNGMCRHKKLIPFDWARDGSTALIAFLGSVLSAGAGTGGGGLFVPLFVLVLRFTTKEAIPLSHAMIAGGALANLLLNMRARGTGGKHLIAVDIALIMEPMTLAGAVVGVMVNVVSPEWLIATLLVVMLVLTTYRTAQKTLKVFRSESLRREKASAPLLTNDEATGVAEQEEGQPISSLPGVEENYFSLPRDRSASSFVRGSLASSPLKVAIKVGLIVFASAGVVVASLLKGDGAAPSVAGVKACSGTYWAILLSSFPFLVLITLASTRWVLSEERERERLGYKYAEGEPRWTPRKCLTYPAVCSLAGAAAGMLGVGGGLIKAPLLIELGVSPQTTAATASFMILFTSSSAVAQFLVLHLIPVQYGIFFSVLGFVGTCVGQIGITKLMKRTQKSWYILLSMTLVLAISTIMLSYMGITKVVSRHSKADLSFQPLCR